jgi:hypothetical protein
MGVKRNQLKRSRPSSCLTVQLALVSLVPLLLVVGAASPTQGGTQQPIEGIWTQGSYYPTKVEVVATGSGTYEGTVLESPVECLPVGLNIWHIQGTGSPYTGTIYWYETSGCAHRGDGQSTFTVQPNGREMRFCSTDPQDPNRTDCVNFTKLIRVTLEGPEFVERVESFEVTATVEAESFDCTGHQALLLRSASSTFGIIKTVDFEPDCSATFMIRLRRDRNLKARIAGDPSSDSDPITVKVR